MDVFLFLEFSWPQLIVGGLLIVCGFVGYCWWLNWVYWQKPMKRFEMQLTEFDRTGDPSVFDD